jgi:type I restriction enzyme S subunit
MASEWRELTIGDLCDAGIAIVQTGPFGSQLHANEYLPQGVPVVPTEAIRNRQIDWSVLPRISKEKAQTLSRHLLQVGDILFARRGIQATGHIGYVRQAEQRMLCGTGAILLRVKKPCELDSEFLSHVLADPRSIEWFKFHAVGATMPNLNDGIIRSFRLTLPRIEEQRRIAVVLSALDDRIEQGRGVCETLEAIARAIFKSWFVDFDPVRAKAEGREPDGMDADTVALFPSEFVESSLGSLPISYFISDLQSECAISMGQSPPGSTYNECVEGLPFFQGRADFKTMFPKRRIYCSEPSRFASAGDVLLSVRAPVGDINIALDDCAIGRGVASIRHKSGSTAYSWCLLKSLKASFDSFDTEGTVFGAINGKDLKALKTVVPPAAIVESFASLFDPVFSKLKLNELEARTLADLRDTLLPRLISGKLRVPEVEAMLTGGCREV